MIGRFINRILIISTIVLVIGFTLIANFLYKKTDETILHILETSIKKELNTLETLIIDQEEQANRQLLYKTKIVNNYINSKIITIQTFKSQVSIININTKEESVGQIRPILIGKKIINESFVKYLKYLSNSHIAILQKFEDGYIITYTDIDDLKKLGYKYYFPINSDIAIYIENKQTYVKKTIIKDKVYKLGIVPLFNGDKIAGAILILDDKWFSDKFKNFFESQTYIENGYSILLDEGANLILHPILKGENIKNTTIFYKIFSNRNSKEIVKIEYIWPETSTGKEKILYIKYLPQYGYYIGIAVFKEKFKTYIAKFKLYYILAVIISLVFAVIFILITESILLQRIKNVSNKFEKFADGEIPEKINISGENYIALEKTFNKIVDNFVKYTKFARELSKGNYSYKFNPVSNQDVLGKELIKIKDHLENVHKDIEKREKEEKIRAWRNAGIEKFINILSHREQELNKWSFQIIKTAVQYLNAFQGGLFILEEDETNPEKKFFNLIASYAFNEEKLLNRKISVTSGIFAKLYKSPKILYIEQLKENYLIITSALGQVKPQSIVLVPLIYNNVLIGAMELDSFQKIEKYQLEFLEEIAGHISASLSSWKVAQETEMLLKRYQKQSEKFTLQQKELEQKNQQLVNLDKKYKNLELEYKTTLKLINHFAYVLELDENGKILSVNDKFASLYGKNNSFFVKKFINEFTGFDILSNEYKFKWEQILNGKIINTIETITISEKTIWLNEYFVAIKDTDNNFVKVYLIALDITETKMLERQLRFQIKEISKETRLLRREERKLKKEKEEFEKQKKQYQFLLNLYDKTLGRIILNPQKIIINANDWIAKILLYEKKEILEQSFENLLLKAEISKFNQTFNLAIDNKEITDTFQLLRKDGNSVKLTIHFFIQEIDKKKQNIYLLIQP